jgi:hypothetical protein
MNIITWFKQLLCNHDWQYVAAADNGPYVKVCRKCHKYVEISFEEYDVMSH